MSQSSLERARAVARPTREEMLQRSYSVHQFWNQNKELFVEAWKEWEEGQNLVLDRSLYAPALREAIEQAWEDPTKEIALNDVWEEVFPGVYKAQFFDPERLQVLRDYMEAAAESDIPVRPPYGLVLNRAGAMLDERSEGYLAAPGFQAFYQDLMDSIMRPVSRLLFPDVMGFDTQTFGFSIQWAESTDKSLQAHTDASSVTLNINLNLPGEDFSGSAVSFFDRATKRVEKLTFEPGTALIHHGSVPHASEPITSGQRSNFVLWLYGEGGQIPPVGMPHAEIDPRERWSVPNAASDGFAPF